MIIKFLNEIELYEVLIICYEICYLLYVVIIKKLIKYVLKIRLCMFVICIVNV